MKFMKKFLTTLAIVSFAAQSAYSADGLTTYEECLQTILQLFMR